MGQSRNFDHLTDNGIYSGANIYSTGTGDNGYPLTAYETFVLIVINGYLTSGGVSQLKYSLLPDGTTCVATRTMQDNVWSEWHDISTVDKEINANSVNPVQNKTIAQALQDAIEEGRKLAKRDLFIAAGAEYNDSGADKTKTAPWGETVTHKAGHYYLNGLGDITDEQMMTIYTHKEFIFKLDCGRIMQSMNVRTIYPLHQPQAAQIFKNRPLAGTETFRGSSVEVLYWNKSSSKNKYNYMPVAGLYNSFNGCSNLRIIGYMDCSLVNKFNNSFDGCISLEYVKLYGVCSDISFADSPYIGQDSILFIIANSLPQNAITITLHPDAYARLKDDAEIVAALEAQPLISLVSA